MYFDSESNIGKVINTRRKECILASKSINRKKDEICADIEESLRQLHTDKIEIYQIHALRPHEIPSLMDKGGGLEGFKKAKEEGMIDHIGLTSHHINILIDLLKTGEFDTVMFPFNVIEREAEKELIPLAKSHDIGSMVMKPLAGGVIRTIENSFRFFHAYPIGAILNGVANIAELQENLKSAENQNPLTPEELADFEEEVTSLGKDFCRRCSYCMPCPNDIQIPVMIHTPWQMVNGLHYEDLSSEKKNVGTTLLPWLQACEECGQCEEKCPYHLPTIKRKKELIEMFSR